MKYSKPEAMLATAITDVRSSTSNKLIQVVQDGLNPDGSPRFGTSSAYEADE